MSADITVVTATVCRPTLKRAVESVQMQSLSPARHCLLLQQIMRAPLDLAPPTAVPLDIHWMPPPQPNIVEAYNVVEAMADTEFVAMLDDDCWWEPNHLVTLYGLIQETGADFVWSSSILEDEETGDFIGLRNDPEPAFQHIDTNEILFRRSCIERWGGFDMAECDPQELPKLRGIDGRRIERWVAAGAKYAHSSEPTCHYGWRAVPEY